jgi:hypothetical protein
MNSSDEKIEISGIIKYKTTKDSIPPDLDRVDTYVYRIAQDAVYGSFGDFPSYWNDKKEKGFDNLCVSHVEKYTDEYLFLFRLSLSARIFVIEFAGLQHLISMLSGDLFERATDSGVESVTVKKVDLPMSMRNEAEFIFRRHKAHTISEIIRDFRLNDMPLLAFSFKPRMGIRFDEVKAITLGVLKEGFNIVEFDTRNLAIREKDIKNMLSLAKEASELKCTHVTRFSPNLSVPAPLITELVEKFVNVQDPPVIVKIDGGLDGISSCQAVRRKCFPLNKSPFITCYPLLRKQLDNRITSDFYIDSLSMSGVDIIYTGGRPNLGSSGSLGEADKGALKNAVRRYRNIISKGWPMPTIAGGIKASELYSFHTLFGNKVAYFLGGAVALHKDGPIEGAKLCVRIFQEAVQKCKDLKPGESPPMLSEELIIDIEEAYNLPEADRQYINPLDLFNSRNGLSPFWNHM